MFWEKLTKICPTPITKIWSKRLTKGGLVNCQCLEYGPIKTSFGSQAFVDVKVLETAEGLSTLAARMAEERI